MLDGSIEVKLLEGIVKEESFVKLVTEIGILPHNYVIAKRNAFYFLEVSDGS